MGGGGFLSPPAGSGGGVASDVSVVDSVLPDGAATEATLEEVESTVAQRFGGGFTTSSSVISSAGDNVVYTPSSGKKIRLHWLGLSSSQNNPGEALATVKLGALVIYTWYMGNPAAFSHWESITANTAGDSLIVNLDVAGNSVAVNFTVEEV